MVFVAKNGVPAWIAVQRVVVSPAVHAVATLAAVQGVDAWATIDHVFRVTAIDKIIASSTIHGVPPPFCVDDVRSDASVYQVFAASSVNDVGTCAAIDIVRPLPAIHEVLTVLAEQRIELRATKDGVLAASSINHVQPADGVEDVIATAAVDDVVSTGAHDAVAPVGAGGLPHVLVHEDEVAVVGTQLFELFLVCGDAHVRSRTRGVGAREQERQWRGCEKESALRGAAVGGRSHGQICYACCCLCK
mmetsp:Transcript_10576/g.38876  ORF Transcript_10576/g.38876 Transcript_10576/m.38876 type:complete len:247 (+) Transcript_10576:629-1369(+)